MNRSKIILAKQLPVPVVSAPASSRKQDSLVLDLLRMRNDFARRQSGFRGPATSTLFLHHRHYVMVQSVQKI
jgi:hypothetical protein